MSKELNEEVKAYQTKRALLLKTVGIPKTQPWSIIIPPNEVLNGFCRKSYHPEYCEEYISKHEFDEVIDNICKLASLAYSQKRNNDNKQLSATVTGTFWVCLGFIF